MGPIGEELMASSISCPAMDDLGRVIWLTPPHVFGGELVIKMDALLDRRVLTRLLEQKEDRTCLIIFHRHPVLIRVNRLPILERSSLPSRKNALSL